jgi:hypothetical protein
MSIKITDENGQFLAQLTYDSKSNTIKIVSKIPIVKQSKNVEFEKTNSQIFDVNWLFESIQKSFSDMIETKNNIDFNEQMIQELCAMENRLSKNIVDNDNLYSNFCMNFDESYVSDSESENTAPIMEHLD